MSFDPKDFVGVGDFLRRAADDGSCPAEAAYRAAIGRYYYASLLAARQLVERSSPMPADRGDTTHSKVIGALRESADPEAQRLERELNTMRTTRNKAEYGEDFARIADVASQMAKSCGRALAYIVTLERRWP